MELKSVLDDFSDLGALGTPKTDDEYLELLKENGINTEEIEQVLKTSGKQMILATAGSGKSTVLELKFLRDKILGCLSKENTKPEDLKKKVLITTFLASGAGTMEVGLRKRAYEFGLGTLSFDDVSFANMHKEFLALLRLVGVQSEVLQDTANNSYLKRRLLSSLCRKFSLGNSPEYPTQQELNTLESTISLYRNTVLSKFHLTESNVDAKDMGITVGNLPRLVEEYKQLRNRNDVIDFDDMIELIYTYFANPETRQPHLYDLYVSRYKYIMLDEFQDTSELQYCVLKPLFETCENVIVVGDDDQSIYSFRAANAETLQWYAKEYEPTITPLTRSYRCPKNILMPIARVIENNEGRFPKDIKAARDGGELEVLACSDIEVMTKIALKEIDDALAKNKSIAILSRTNFAYSPVLLHYVLKYGGKFTIFGEAYDLNKARYKRVWQLLHLLEGRGLESLKQNIKLIDPDIKPWDVSKFEKWLKNEIPHDGNVLSYLEEFARITGSRDLGMFSQKITRAYESGVTDDLELFKLMLQHLIPNTSPAMRDPMITMESLANLSKDVEDFYQNKGYINNVLVAVNKNQGNSSVVFSTPHGFKGKQVDNVVVFNASDGIFPSWLSTAQDLPEERRNFFIVGTRAKERQVYLPMEDKISSFVEELNVPISYLEDVDYKVTARTQQEVLKEQLEKEEPSILDIDLNDLF